MLGPQSYKPPENGQLPQEVRIQGLRAEPWSEDGRRLRIHLDVTPFLERPDIEVTISNANGEALSNISIIESIDAHMAFTMHLRGAPVEGPLSLSASISYPDIGQIDQKSVFIDI